MITGLQLLFRTVTCTLLTFLLFFSIDHLVTKIPVRSPESNSLILIPVLIVSCLLWFWIVGMPFIQWFSSLLGGFLTSDDGMEYKPDYSMAEARVKEGNFSQAIIEFRKYIEQFPLELTPHIRIADILLTEFDDPKNAIEELKIAAEKSNAVESFALINFRLSEIYLDRCNHGSAAILCLQEIQRRFPKTVQAEAALKRAEKLIDRKSSSSL